MLSLATLGVGDQPGIHDNASKSKTKQINKNKEKYTQGKQNNQSSKETEKIYIHSWGQEDSSVGKIPELRPQEMRKGCTWWCAPDPSSGDGA